MKRNKFSRLILPLLLTLTLAFPSMVFGLQTTDTGTATLTGNPDTFVDVAVNDNTISYGSLNISDQAAANGRTESNTEYVIFESEHDISNDSIAFDEGATNSNAFYKVTYTGETYPLGSGLTSTNWLFLKDSATGTGYIKSQVTGSLSSGGGGVTMPGGVNEVGSYSQSFVYYTTADSGLTWTRTSKTIYVALGDNGRLYVDDSANLASAEYITAKGGETDDAFLGNQMILSTAFPTQTGDTVTLDFGYYLAWDATQGNGDKTFHTLVDMPKHAATGHNWTWNLTITGEYHSDP